MRTAPGIRIGRSFFHGYFPHGREVAADQSTRRSSCCTTWAAPPCSATCWRCLRSQRRQRSSTAFMIWQLFTYMFLHGGIWHLLFNMLTLWMFGMPLEQRLGHAAVSEVLLLLRHRRRPLRCCSSTSLLGDWSTPHHRRFGRHLRPAAGVRRLYPEPDRADELPVPHQGQVHGDDLRRHRAADDVRRRTPASAPSRTWAAWCSASST